MELRSVESEALDRAFDALTKALAILDGFPLTDVERIAVLGRAVGVRTGYLVWRDDADLLRNTYMANFAAGQLEAAVAKQEADKAEAGATVQ